MKEIVYGDRHVTRITILTHYENAHRTVSSAKASGKLKAEPCAVCGREPAQAHHPDYSKPLSVVWLCRLHHEWLHAVVDNRTVILGVVVAFDNLSTDSPNNPHPAAAAYRKERQGLSRSFPRESTALRLLLESKHLVEAVDFSTLAVESAAIPATHEYLSERIAAIRLVAQRFA